jgi:hypothetical protein
MGVAQKEGQRRGGVDQDIVVPFVARGGGGVTDGWWCVGRTHDGCCGRDGGLMPDGRFDRTANVLLLLLLLLLLRLSIPLMLLLLHLHVLLLLVGFLRFRIRILSI